MPAAAGYSDILEAVATMSLKPFAGIRSTLTTTIKPDALDDQGFENVFAVGLSEEQATF